MNWAAVAAIAELVAAVGVIASLLYLAAQVRSGANATRAASAEAAIRSMREIMMPFSGDPDSLRLFGNMFRSFEQLDAEEQDRAVLWMFQLFKAAESIHYHYLRGMLDGELWSGWDRLMQHYASTPGFQEYWTLRSDVYSQSFQDYVRDLSVISQGRVLGKLDEPGSS